MDNDFVITGRQAMITYVVELSGQKDLLGKDLADQAKIDAFRLKGNL